MLPVIIAQLVVTLKDTALGFIITYPELLYFAKLLGSNAVLGSPLIPAAIVAGTIYVSLCLALSYVAHARGAAPPALAEAHRGSRSRQRPDDHHRGDRRAGGGAPHRARRRRRLLIASSPPQQGRRADRRVVGRLDSRV